MRRANATPLPKPEDVRLPGTQGPAPYFVNYVTDQLVARYGAERVFGGGLEVTTTIDLDLQDKAREAIEKILPDPDGPAAALVAIDPHTGAVKAMFGGTNFHRSQFNLATQAERQPGLVLQAARARRRAPQGHRPGDAHHVEADRDRRRRSDLAGHELRGQLPGEHRPDDGDGALGQLGLRPADEHRRPAVDRRDRAPARDPLEASGVLLDRARFRRRQPARHGARVRDDRERREARGRLDHEGPAARRAERRVPPERQGGGERAGRPRGAHPGRGGDPHGRAREGRPGGHGDARPAPGTRGRGQDGHERRLRRRVVRRLHARPRRRRYGSAIRTSSSRWRRSSTASPSPAARSPRSSGRRSWGAPWPGRRRRRSHRRRTCRRTTHAWCSATAGGGSTTASARRRASSATSPAACPPRRRRATRTRCPSRCSSVARWTRHASRSSLCPLGADVVYVPAKPRTRPGEVVQQTPRGGFLSANGTVRLWVSAAQDGLVPNLVGSSLPGGARAQPQAEAEAEGASTGTGPRARSSSRASRRGSQPSRGCRSRCSSAGAARPARARLDVAPVELGRARDADPRRPDDCGWLDGRQERRREARRDPRRCHSPVTPSACVSRPGPEQSSRSSSTPRRTRIRSRPWVGSSARRSTAAP